MDDSATQSNAILRKNRINSPGKRALTIEVLVAVDQSMIKYHGKSNVKDYAMTLMSLASFRFDDLEIEYSIGLAVTPDFLYIEEDLQYKSVYNYTNEYLGNIFKKLCIIFDLIREHFDSKSGKDSEDMWEKFSMYMQRADQKQYTYDVALLLTRYSNAK